MSVDAALALRVLAHELRSPAAVAQGYVRMLLDGRLTAPADRQRAMEQIRDVLGRVGQLSRQASDTAGWFERAGRAAGDRLDARRMTDDAIAAARQSYELDCTVDVAPGAGTLATVDGPALSTAVAAMIEAIARERPGRATEVRVAVRDADGSAGRALEVLTGGSDRLSGLAAGPASADATPVPLERGGLGLALVIAALVLSAHGAHLWTIDGERGACAIRLPLET